MKSMKGMTAQSEAAMVMKSLKARSKVASKTSPWKMIKTDGNLSAVTGSTSKAASNLCCYSTPAAFGTSGM